MNCLQKKGQIKREHAPMTFIINININYYYNIQNYLFFIMNDYMNDYECL